VQVRFGRYPTQLGARSCRGGDQLRRVARATRRGLHRYHGAGDRSDHVHDRLVGEAVAITEVVDLVPAGVDGVEGEQVGGFKVCDVDVIADARAVRRGIVVAEDLQLLAPARSDL